MHQDHGASNDIFIISGKDAPQNSGRILEKIRDERGRVMSTITKKDHMSEHSQEAIKRIIENVVNIEITGDR